MGSLSKLLGMLPGMGQIKDQIDNIDEREVDRIAGDHQVDDPGRAARPEDHQRLAAAADRQRLRHQVDATSTSWSSGSSRPGR